MTPHQDPAPPSFLARYGVILLGVALAVLVLGGLGFAWKNFQEDHARHPRTSQDLPTTPSKTLLNKPKVSLSQLSTMGNSEAEEKSKDWQLTSWQPENATGLESQARALMDKFWQTEDWREKLKLVHQPERVGSLMETYYTSGSEKEPERGTLQSCSFYRTTTLQIVHMIYDNHSGARMLEVALLKQPDERYLLDWSSFSGVGEMLWQDFTRLRVAQPTLIRGYAQISDYYNYEFSDEQKYLCVKLFSPDMEKILYAYVQRNTPSMAARLRLLVPGQPSPVSLRLAYPAMAQSDECVQLTEFVANRWLTP